MTTTLWLTGLPSSGKSTLGEKLAERHRGHRAVEHLDGDVVRREMFPELGFDREDRIENIRRIGKLASMLASHDVLVVVSVIAPFRTARADVRADHEGQGLNFVEVHVHAPIDVCVERDVKGLYAKAERGEVAGLTGFSDIYEAPSSPEVRVDTSDCDVEEGLQMIERALDRCEREQQEAILR
ncbi:adenylyl-sulfate kinase [Amycolatopsis sp. lyj-112]|uniref:adenylyl-sulfate kinase n=1 Tax=Amycolatopsis sp. lyj-112 TaxID=2789288 RepID=UPI00397DE613